MTPHISRYNIRWVAAAFVAMLLRAPILYGEQGLDKEVREAFDGRLEAHDVGEDIKRAYKSVSSVLGRLVKSGGGVNEQGDGVIEIEGPQFQKAGKNVSPTVQFSVMRNRVVAVSVVGKLVDESRRLVDIGKADGAWSSLLPEKVLQSNAFRAAATGYDSVGKWEIGYKYIQWASPGMKGLGYTVACSLEGKERKRLIFGIMDIVGDEQLIKGSAGAVSFDRNLLQSDGDGVVLLYERLEK